MWKKIWLGLVGLVLGLIIYLYVRYPRPNLQAEVADKDYCEMYGIEFDTSSIEAIYENPAAVQQAGEQFRSRDPAYQFFNTHRQRVNKRFPVERWEKTLERLSSLPIDKRKQQLPFRMYQDFMAQKQTFCKQVIPFVKTYLPEGTDLSATVYITALENAAAGGALQREIAYTLSSPLFTIAARIHRQSGATSVFNLLGHELAHIGYGVHNDLHSFSEEEMRKNEIVIDILSPIHNDGFATYVSYQLSERYPIPFEWPHWVFKREFFVKWYLQRVNDLLALAGTPAGTEEYNETYRRIGIFGYNQMGFYVVGAHMAMTIEEHYGREALVKTVEDGFYAFVDTYNSVAAEQMKIHYTLR